MDGAPKTSPILISVRFPIKQDIAPAMLVAHAIKGEQVVAKAASMPKRHTNTGTVSMLPPPPINPNNISISTAAKYPAVFSLLKLGGISTIQLYTAYFMIKTLFLLP